jgi:hypothetical protein
MIKLNINRFTGFNVNDSFEGETIEQKMERVIENNEPISDSAPIIYTERTDGVLPQYDVRTDRFEIAIDAMDKVSKTHVAKRIELYKKSDDLEHSSDNTSDTTGTSEN